jgi:hypothetical protein
MPYGAYTQKIQVTVGAGVTNSTTNPLGRIPDEVTVVTDSGDAQLVIDNWAADGTTFDATNPGAVSNTSTLILVYRHSLAK